MFKYRSPKLNLKQKLASIYGALPDQKEQIQNVDIVVGRKLIPHDW